MPNFTRKHLIAMICFALATGTFAVYLPMLHHSFINYDDPDYITGNSHVKAGLTWSGIVWAFTSGDAANWHPLTWISHMMDCQLFGLNPIGHHLTNLIFHVANTLLLFLLLNRLTGAIWRSAFVAALFAWHPLHVESVAWASERKDVLSAFFWMLTLLAYTRFAQLTKIQNAKAKYFYILSLILFACGLMSKPMVVTLPFVLLLLDFWPLQRIQNFEIKNARRLVLEKIPFFILALISCIITLRAQKEAMWSPAALPFSMRAANAAVSCVRYISKIFWPSDLALIYPYQMQLPVVAVIGAAALLALLTAIFILRAKQFPYLAVGWLWFLGTLVPVIGLVQVGAASIADRYTYLPGIGIFILVAWGLNDLLNSQPQKKIILAIAATITFAGCLAATSIQLNYWQNSVEIFWHTIKITNDNYAAYDCFGKALEDIGKKNDAADFYADAVRLNPNYPMSQFDLGMIEIGQGKSGDASNHLAAATRLLPGNAVMQFDFGVFLAQNGKTNEAAAHFLAAMKAEPDFIEARQQLDSLSGRTNSPANRSTP